jgi:hypothetical protein
MSGRISIGFVDFTAVLFDFDHVCCVSIKPFLVRNWCGPSTSVERQGANPDPNELPPSDEKQKSSDQANTFRV